MLKRKAVHIEMSCLSKNITFKSKISFAESERVFAEQKNSLLQTEIKKLLFKQTMPFFPTQELP
jgi:hypothetical protein